MFYFCLQGLLFAFAIFAKDAYHLPEEALSMTTVAAVKDGSNVTAPPYQLPARPPCPPLIDNDYKPVYFCSMRKEAFCLGSISLAVTFINIAAIICMALLTFYVGLLVMFIFLMPSFCDMYGFFRRAPSTGINSVLCFR